MVNKFDLYSNELKNGTFILYSVYYSRLVLGKFYKNRYLDKN